MSELDYWYLQDHLDASEYPSYEIPSVDLGASSYFDYSNKDIRQRHLPTWSTARLLNRKMAVANPSGSRGRTTFGDNPNEWVKTRISETEFNNIYAKYGMKWNDSMTWGDAALMREWRLYENAIEQGMHHSKGGAGRMVADFFMQIPVQLLDPAVVGASILVPEAKIAHAVTKGLIGKGLAKTGVGKVFRGSVGGAIGNAAIEPAVYFPNLWNQTPYGALDSVMNITMGAALGGGFKMIPPIYRGSLRATGFAAETGAAGLRSVSKAVGPDTPLGQKLARGEQVLNNLGPEAHHKAVMSKMTEMLKDGEDLGTVIAMLDDEKFLDHAIDSAGDLNDNMKALYDNLEKDLFSSFDKFMKWYQDNRKPLRTEFLNMAKARSAGTEYSSQMTLPAAKSYDRVLGVPGPQFDATGLVAAVGDMLMDNGLIAKVNGLNVPSVLSPMAYHSTRTDAFKRQFGDWESRDFKEEGSNIELDSITKEPVRVKVGDEWSSIEVMFGGDDINAKITEKERNAIKVEVRKKRRELEHEKLKQQFAHIKGLEELKKVQLDDDKTIESWLREGTQAKAEHIKALKEHNEHINNELDDQVKAKVQPETDGPTPTKPVVDEEIRLRDEAVWKVIIPMLEEAGVDPKTWHESLKADDRTAKKVRRMGKLKDFLRKLKELPDLDKSGISKTTLQILDFLADLMQHHKAGEISVGMGRLEGSDVGMYYHGGHKGGDPLPAKVELDVTRGWQLRHNPGAFLDILLHETVHAMTVDTIDIFFSPKITTLPIRQSGLTGTEYLQALMEFVNEEPGWEKSLNLKALRNMPGKRLSAAGYIKNNRELINSIQDIMTLYMDFMDQFLLQSRFGIDYLGDLPGYIKEKKRRGETGSDPAIYASLNWKEFIANGLGDPDVRGILNNKIYQSAELKTRFKGAWAHNGLTYTSGLDALIEIFKKGRFQKDLPEGIASALDALTISFNDVVTTTTGRKWRAFNYLRDQQDVPEEQLGEGGFFFHPSKKDPRDQLGEKVSLLKKIKQEDKAGRWIDVKEVGRSLENMEKTILLREFKAQEIDQELKAVFLEDENQMEPAYSNVFDFFMKNFPQLLEIAVGEDPHFPPKGPSGKTKEFLSDPERIKKLLDDTEAALLAEANDLMDFWDQSIEGSQDPAQAKTETGPMPDFDFVPTNESKLNNLKREYINTANAAGKAINSLEKDLAQGEVRDMDGFLNFLHTAYQDRRVALLNYQILDNFDKARVKSGDKISKALNTYINGSHKHYGLHQRIKSNERQITGELTEELKKNDLLEDFMSDKYKSEIYHATAILDGMENVSADDINDLPTKAINITKIIRGVRRRQQATINLMGGDIKWAKNHARTRRHSPEKILRGVQKKAFWQRQKADEAMDQWVDFVWNNEINKELTFHYNVTDAGLELDPTQGLGLFLLKEKQRKEAEMTGRLLPIDEIRRIVMTSPEGQREFTMTSARFEEEAKRMLQHIVGDILDPSRADPKKNNDLLMGSKDEMELARTIVFNTWEANLKYDDQYGGRSFAEGTLMDLSSRAKGQAMMEMFGSHEDKMFDAIHDAYESEIRAEAKKDKNIVGVNLRSYWDKIIGESDNPLNHTMNRMSAVVRSFLIMGQLEKAVVASLADKASLRSTMRANGIRGVVGMGRNLEELVKTEDGKNLLLKLGVGAEQWLGEASLRFNYNEHLTGAAANAQRGFFKAIGMNSWNRMNQGRAVAMMSSNLADNANKNFADLDPRLKLSLSKYDISEADWDALRETGGQQVDPTGTTTSAKTKFITLDSTEMASAAMIDLARAGSGIDRKRYRMRLKQKLMTYYSSEMDNAVLMPGNWEMTNLHMGTKAGTVWGEMVRFASLYKAFGLTVLSRVGKREVAWTKSGGGVQSLVAYVSQAIVYGYISHLITSLLNNKKPQGIYTYEGAISTLKKSGILGVLGDAMLGEFYAEDKSAMQNTANNIGSYLSGPVGGIGLRIHDAVGEVMNSGEYEYVDSHDAPGVEGKYGGYYRQLRDTRGKRMLFQTLIDNTPYLDYPLIGLALDTMIWSNVADKIDKGYEGRRNWALERKGSGTLFDPEPF